MERRVLFLHESFPAGGAERVTVDVANYISIFNYQTFVCSRLQSDFKGTNIQLIELPDKICTISLVNIDFLVETINTMKIDIFVLPVQTFVELCENIKARTTCKLVFALHSIPFWEVTYRLYEKKKNSRGSIGKLLEWYLLTYPKTVWLKKYNRVFADVYSRIYLLADAYTVLCDEYKQELVKVLNIQSNNDKIKVIHNSENVVEEVSIDKKKQVLFVGRFTYEDKRVDRLLKIWNRVYRHVSDWELILVGDGPERDSLEEYIEKKRIDRVRFVGYSDQVASFYQDAAVICLTSTFEGWPLCLTEAQANAVIPIAFDCSSGVHDILSPSGQNGLLIPPRGMRKFAKALVKLLKDDARRKQMHVNVVQKSLLYAPDIVGEKWLQMFNELLS